MTRARRPSFILFITDQQRADHVGAYGNTIVRTPHIDSLAARGWLAERCYVASPICMPNRASLMTGRLPSVHGARHNGIPLSLRARTFVERLREHGYRTALVGKSHLQNITRSKPTYPANAALGEARLDEPGRFNQETQPLWDEQPDFEVDSPFYGFEDVRLVLNHGDTAGGHYKRWLAREHPETVGLVGPANAIATPDFELSRANQAWRTRVPETLSTTSYVARETCERLAHYAQSTEPFFIQCSFPDPHHPFTPPGRFWDMYRPEDMSLPRSFHAPHSGRTPHRDWMLSERDLGRAVKNAPTPFAASERETREALALNYGSIAHIDEAIGQVLATLARLGLDKDTVLLFTSDHGDYFGDHQLLWKGPLHYQSIVRVPLIWCDRAGPAGRNGSLCSTLDIAPTVLARAGVNPYNGMQGHDLLPLMKGECESVRDALLIEEEGQRVMFGFDRRTRMRTLQTPRWRLSVYEAADWGELYDLDRDPDECHNLWEDAAHSPVRQSLMHELLRQLIRSADESPGPTAIA